MKTARDRFRDVQAALGIVEAHQDGIPGPETAKAYSDLAQAAFKNMSPFAVEANGSRILTGAPGWKFSAMIEGADIVLRDVTATWFGGVDDPLDNGETSSGISTRALGVMGCALPLVADHPSTHGSPIAFPGARKLAPGIPWFTECEISYEGKTVRLEVIDNGPARSAGDACDLTQAAFKAVAPGVSLKVGVLHGVTVRIIGAAKYVPV